MAGPTVTGPEVRVVIQLLEQALLRLSWDAGRQLEHLSRLGVGPDEPALEFDHVFARVAGMVRAGLVPLAVAEVLRPVDRTLAEMTESGEREWSVRAVSESPAWRRLREAAGVALQSVRPSLIRSGRAGRIGSGEDAGKFVKVEELPGSPPSHLVLMSRDREFTDGCGDYWVEDRESLEAFFVECGWGVDWAGADGQQQ
ncbi:hypothetical protein [Streptomyces sp. NPDC058964]|uniref:hypothetical protein n=1 Tax=Streptomyces sp. NPDC058964 TaxID=3346681 RepID=UPI0036807EFB